MKTVLSNLLIVIIACCLFSGCGLELPKQPFTGERLENYAQERYLVALAYMEQGRFELASQQFAIAADSAQTSKLKSLATEGHEKANIIIVGRR